LRTITADFVFPFHPEEILIFENAIRLHPEQAAAYYYWVTFSCEQRFFDETLLLS
jgi:hypothetical protein